MRSAGSPIGVRRTDAASRAGRTSGSRSGGRSPSRAGPSGTRRCPRSRGRASAARGTARGPSSPSPTTIAPSQTATGSDPSPHRPLTIRARRPTRPPRSSRPPRRDEDHRERRRQAPGGDRASVGRRARRRPRPAPARWRRGAVPTGRSRCKSIAELDPALAEMHEVHEGDERDGEGRAGHDAAVTEAPAERGQDEE